MTVEHMEKKSEQPNMCVNVIFNIVGDRQPDYKHQNRYNKHKYYTDEAFKKHKIALAKAAYARRCLEIPGYREQINLKMRMARAAKKMEQGQCVSKGEN